jgi:hypothetical protein
MIDEDPAHQLRRNTEELRTVLPRRASLIDQAHVQLVHEGSRRERVVGTFSPQLA